MHEEIKQIATHYGIQSRIDKLIEEMAELTVELSHYKEGRGDIEHIAEEMADVEILMHEVSYLMPITQQNVDKWKVYKVKRQLDRILEGK